MTAMCGGGTSGPKTGAAAVVDYTSGLLAAIFAAYDLVWLIPVIPLVGLAPLTLSTFCASDPPAMPVFTAAEVNALLQMTFFSADYLTGLAKLKDLCLNLIWPEVCQCTSGALVVPSPPAPPAGTAITQFQPTSLSQCLTQAPSSVSYVGTSTGNSSYSVAWRNPANVTIRTETVGVVVGLTSLSATLPIPIGATSLLLTITEPIVYPTGFNRGGFDFTGFNTAKAVRFDLSKTYNAGTNQTTDTWGAGLLCGDAAGQSQLSTCCPADPATQATLDAILNLVTLVQRQIAPFAYIKSTLHAPLTGNGEFAVQGTIGALVEFPFDVPTHFGQVVGDPNAIFIDSWIRWGNADGWTEREFLSAQPYISLPPLAGQWTKIGYSLAPGVDCNITELKREP